jgi:hypothetical protein
MRRSISHEAERQRQLNLLLESGVLSLRASERALVVMLLARLLLEAVHDEVGGGMQNDET